MGSSLKDVGKDGSKQVLDGTGMPDIHCRGHLAPLVPINIGKDGSKQLQDGPGMPDIHCSEHLAPLVSISKTSYPSLPFPIAKQRWAIHLKMLAKMGPNRS